MHFFCARVRIQAPELKQADGLLIHKGRVVKGQPNAPYSVWGSGAGLPPKSYDTLMRIDARPVASVQRGCRGCANNPLHLGVPGGA